MIAEAFSKRCPVISTSLGAFGYEVISRKEILLADGPMKFAADCLSLLRDAKLGEELSENAWKKFLQMDMGVNWRCSIRSGYSMPATRAWG
jgi:hypothetical protein